MHPDTRVLSDPELTEARNTAIRDEGIQLRPEQRKRFANLWVEDDPAGRALDRFTARWLAPLCAIAGAVAIIAATVTTGG